MSAAWPSRARAPCARAPAPASRSTYARGPRGRGERERGGERERERDTYGCMHKYIYMYVSRLARVNPSPPFVYRSEERGRRDRGRALTTNFKPDY